jgi:formylglycine-generating enzyme required for sulfatase activity
MNDVDMVADIARVDIASPGSRQRRAVRRSAAAALAVAMLGLGLLAMNANTARAVTWPIQPGVVEQPPASPAVPPAAAAPHYLVEPITGIEFVPVAAGCFDMGLGGVDVVSNICLSVFYISRHEVTNAQFRQFRPSHDSGIYRGLSLNGDDQPAVNVAWADAMDFAAWLGERSSGQYRLPTEAEWEYASRGGSFPLNAADVEAANLRRADAAAVPQALTTPVGSFAPNPLGLFDMWGNASEWVLDNYIAGSGRYGRQGKDPIAYLANSPLRVRRGGSWEDTEATILGGYRDYYRGDLPVPQTGFRLVQQPAPNN